MPEQCIPCRHGWVLRPAAIQRTVLALTSFGANENGALLSTVLKARAGQCQDAQALRVLLLRSILSRIEQSALSRTRPRRTHSKLENGAAWDSFGSSSSLYRLAS